MKVARSLEMWQLFTSRYSRKPRTDEFSVPLIFYIFKVASGCILLFPCFYKPAVTVRNSTL
jgi:hypothetical protein